MNNKLEKESNLTEWYKINRKEFMWEVFMEEDEKLNEETKFNNFRRKIAHKKW